MNRLCPCVGVSAFLAAVAVPSSASAAPGVTRDPVAVCGVPNGCGPAGGPSTDKVMFNASRSTHDRCYATLGKTQKQCDDEFRQDMYQQCRNRGMGTACFSAADTFYALPANLGKDAYLTAQACALKIELENAESDATAILQRVTSEARLAGNAAEQSIAQGLTRTRNAIGDDVADVKASDARVSSLRAEHNPPAAGTAGVIKAPSLAPKLAAPVAIIDPSSKAAQLDALAKKMKPIVDDTNANVPSREQRLANHLENTARAAAGASIVNRGAEVTALAQETKTQLEKARKSPVPLAATANAVALQKIAEARTKYAALASTIAADVKAASGDALGALDLLARDIAKNKADAAALRAQADAIAAPPPPEPDSSRKTTRKPKPPR